MSRASNPQFRNRRHVKSVSFWLNGNAVIINLYQIVRQAVAVGRGVEVDRQAGGLGADMVPVIWHFAANRGRPAEDSALNHPNSAQGASARWLETRFVIKTAACKIQKTDPKFAKSAMYSL